jgi:hypothetical protein
MKRRLTYLLALESVCVPSVIGENNVHTNTSSYETGIIIINTLDEHGVFMQCLLFARLRSTAICAAHEDPMVASLNLQEHLNIIEKWLKKWKIKVNESKSSQIAITLRKGHCHASTKLPYLKQK